MRKITTLIFILTSCMGAFAQQDSAKAFFDKGDSAFMEKRYLLAEKYYSKGMRFDAENMTVINNLSNCYLEMRKYGLALPIIQKIYDKTSDKEALKKLAEFYFNTKNPEATIKYNLLCLEQNIGTKNNYRLARVYYDQEDYPNAAKYLKGASTDEPNNAEVPYLMANIWTSMQVSDKAIEMYKIALEMDTTNPQWHFELGNIYHQLDSLQSATTYYEKAITKGLKNDLDMQRSLGICYVNLKQFEKGENIIKNVIAKKPFDKTLFEEVGYAFYNNKKYDDAIRFWDEILKLDQNEARALYMIGIAYKKKGDDDKGNRLCDTAINMDPKLGALRSQMQMPIGAGL